jgi:hypothetical protein
VIVVYPDDVIGFGDACHHVGEGRVHSLIGLPRLLAVFGIEREVVKERPDGLVAETVVVGFDILLRDGDRVATLRKKPVP